MTRTARGPAPLLLRLMSLAALVALVAVGATACSGRTGDADHSSADGGSTSSRSLASGADAVDAPAAASEAASDQGAKADATTDPATEIGLDPQVIRTGEVALSSPDVARARAEVLRVVARYAGQVADEDTQSDEHGRPAYVQMVLRIPTDDFTEAMTAVGKAGELESSHTKSDDVTAKVVDVQTRVAAQKRSIARITVLFDRAEDIKDVMAIESELAQRQADLDALERQQAYLASQTSLSTIHVSIDVTPAKHPAAEHADHHGFLAGLSAGWRSLSTVGTGLATVLGALLPWLVVVALLGGPAMLVLRSARRRTPAAPDAPAASGQAGE